MKISLDNINPNRLLIAGSALLVLGVVFPFLMVMKVIPSTIFLNFLSFTMQALGLFMGSIGVVYYVRVRKSKDDR